MRIGWKCNREEWKNHTGVGDVGLVATEDVLGLAGKVLGARDLLGDVAFVHGDVTMRTKNWERMWCAGGRGMRLQRGNEDERYMSREGED
jgi:hypothetical protein